MYTKEVNRFSDTMFVIRIRAIKRKAIDHQLKVPFLIDNVLD